MLLYYIKLSLTGSPKVPWYHYISSQSAQRLVFDKSLAEKREHFANNVVACSVNTE